MGLIDWAERKAIQLGMVVGVSSRQLERQATEPRESFQEDPMNVDLITQTGHGGLMAVTPEEYEDDVNAFLFYGTFGLFDPKNAVLDAPALKASTGWSFGKSFAAVTLGGFVTYGIAGWLIDPADKRDGGWAETEGYQKTIGLFLEGYDMVEN